MPDMELFRGDGRRTWQLRFTDHLGLRRQLSARTDSRGTALNIGQTIDRLVEYRMRHDPLPPDLLLWLQAAHLKTREKLTKWEIVDSCAAGSGKPLYHDPAPETRPPDWKEPSPALVDLWEQDLTAREVSEGYAAQSAQRVRVLLGLPVADQPPIRQLAHVTAEGLMARVRELRRIGPPPRKGYKSRQSASPQTCEHYLTKTREFFAWLVAKGHAQSNPAKGLTAYSDAVIQASKVRARRAFTLDEQTSLITGTPALADRWNMTGSERALLYRTALRTGLRAREVRLLTVASFNFFTKILTVLARDTKASREDRLPISEELIPLLQAHFSGKHPAASAFTPLSEDSYCRMLRDDLEDLGIRYRDDLGRYADFHALRHTYGTDLARVVMPAIHQRLMRHADIGTTMKFYYHADDNDNAAAVAKLPALPSLDASPKKNHEAG